MGHSRTFGPAWVRRWRIVRIVVGALAGMSAALAQPPADGLLDPTDPAEASQWNAAWDDYSTQPIILVLAENASHARAEDLTNLPGVDDSLAARILARLPRPDSPNVRLTDSSLPSFIRPYVRVSGRPGILWRTRGVLSDPAASDRWRRSGTYSRLIASDGKGWDGGLVIERDAGEPGFADYVSGALGYRSPGERWQLVFGHVRAHIGTGLLASRASASWIDLDAFRPRSTLLSATLASTESGELFGVAGRIRPGAWDVLLVVAHPRWDATVDTTREVVTNFRTDGIHVTDAERRARHRLAETYALARVGWSPAESCALGVSAARGDFSLPTMLTLTAREPVDRQDVLGLDVRWRRELFGLWGEAVRDMRGPKGAAGAAEYLVHPVKLVAAGWWYGPDLVLPHGVGWSFRDEATDERAALVGLRWKSGGRLSADVFGARYRQEHASRSDSLPRQGTWEELRWKYRLSDALSLRGWWKHRTRWQPGLGSRSESSRREWRAELLWNRDSWTIRPRGDWVRATPKGYGLLLGLAIERCGSGRRESEALAVSAQLAAFRSTSSDAALYLYDVCAPGYGAMRMLDGTGLAWSGRLGGRLGRARWSLAANGLARRSQGIDVTLTAQLEYALR